MKFVYAINMSEDGIHTKVFSNIKALFNGITEIGYKPLTVNTHKTEKIVYNYNNLVKLIRSSQEKNRVYLCYIQCENGGTLDIMEFSLHSK